MSLAEMPYASQETMMRSRELSAVGLRLLDQEAECWDVARIIARNLQKYLSHSSSLTVDEAKQVLTTFEQFMIKQCKNGAGK